MVWGQNADSVLVLVVNFGFVLRMGWSAGSGLELGFGLLFELAGGPPLVTSLLLVLNTPLVLVTGFVLGVILCSVPELSIGLWNGVVLAGMSACTW